MSRSRLVVLGGALVLVAALAPITGQQASLADQGAHDAAPRLATADTAGVSVVTASMKAQIQRVVAATPSIRPAMTSRLATLARTSTAAATRPLATTLARDLVRCATFDGQRYCIGDGWTDRSATQVRRSMVSAIGQLAGHAQTGDLGPLQFLLRRGRLSPGARAAAERSELTAAAQSVAKVWLLRHEIQGVPLPTGFLQAHPEAAVPASTTASGGTGGLAMTAATTRKETYPRSSSILSTKRVSAQQRTYWCGVASMQMIAWNWSHKERSQRHWAGRLRTTTAGTAITDMVRVINQDTGWDNAKYAGRYIVLDISDWSYNQWFKLIERHISKYHAPVVLHPILLKKFFPYLDHDESGHFQVGRGYVRRSKSYNLIGYFEPWNQQRFDPSEPYIARVQWRSAYRSYLANKAHFQHDIGV